jgi:hypothetical protein
MYLAKSARYEASHYAVFSSILSLNLSHIQTFSAPCPQMPTVYVPSLVSERDQVSYPYRTTGRFIVLHFPVCTFRQTRRLKVVDRMVASITHSLAQIQYELLLSFPDIQSVPHFQRICNVSMWWFCPAFWWWDLNICLTFRAFASRPITLLASIQFSVSFFRVCMLSPSRFTSST